MASLPIPLRLPRHQPAELLQPDPGDGTYPILRECTPMGWNGSYEKWLRILDLIIWLDPEVIVPGHGPVCGIEGAMEMKAYLEYVREESQRCFGQGLSALEAAKKIDFTT